MKLRAASRALAFLMCVVSADRVVAQSNAVGPPAPSVPSSSDDAAAAALAASLPRFQLSPSALDSGLRDCNIPFDELAAKAPSCTRGGPARGRTCEALSPSQFTEVVSIAVVVPGRPQPRLLCTGTLISRAWVLTAAHCVLADKSTVAQVGSPDTDFVSLPTDRIVTSYYALLLEPRERIRTVRRQIVYRGYGGRGEDPGPYYANDIALMELAAPFPANSVEPAVLAPAESFSPVGTLAGYGLTNFNGGGSGQFNLTWPQPLTASNGRLTFTPADGRAFCQGDSGGPVYVGRQRGCRPDDPAPEPRPRQVQAVISFEQPGTFIDASSTALDWAESCISSPLMSTQSITVPELRKWICAQTSNQAGGC